MIEFSVDGDDKVVRTFDRVTPAVREELVKGTGRILLRLLTKVKADKLSGQVLNVRTGRLRRSINEGIDERRIEIADDAVTGIVGTNVEYARAHEFGFNGTVTVKEHLRQIREEGRFALVKSRHRAFGTWTKERGKLTGGVAMVKAHTKHVNLPKRSFLLSALQELEKAGVIDAEYRKAVADGMREAASS